MAISERRLDEADDHNWHARSESVEEARTQLDQYAAMQACFDDWTHQHRDELAERRALDAQINNVLLTRVVEMEDAPPEYLIEKIGQPPLGHDGRAAWRAAAAAVAIAFDARSAHPDVGATDLVADRDNEMDLA